MPHFVIECSANIIEMVDEMALNAEIHAIANDSGLFIESDIKVRVRAFERYLVGGQPSEQFIHVFADIMQGRTDEQKSALSHAIVTHLCRRFPNVDNIAMNVRDFEKATYCNKKALL